MKRTVANFPPEYIELFRRASKVTVSLPLPTKGEATHLRQDLHALRRAMREAGHELLPLAERVELVIEDLGPRTLLHARPKGIKYRQAFEEAGIPTGPLPGSKSPPLSSSEPSMSSPPVETSDPPSPDDDDFEATLNASLSKKRPPTE